MVHQSVSGDYKLTILLQSKLRYSLEGEVTSVCSVNVLIMPCEVAAYNRMCVIKSTNQVLLDFLLLVSAFCK